MKHNYVILLRKPLYIEIIFFNILKKLIYQEIVMIKDKHKNKIPYTFKGSISRKIQKVF